MKKVNVKVASGPDTANVTGSLIDSNQLLYASFQAVFSDATAAGTFIVQASNDITPDQLATNFVPVNWTQIPNATATITVGGTALILIPQCSFRWMRVLYTRTSGGSGTLTVNMFALSA